MLLECTVPVYVGSFSDARTCNRAVAAGSFRPGCADLCSRSINRIAKLSKTAGLFLAGQRVERLRTDLAGGTERQDEEQNSRGV